MVSFLNGAAAMACAGITVFFLRFWRESEDRLFPCLAIAFLIFAVNYAVLALLPLADERRTIAFALRLVGFTAILVGVLLKSRDLSEHLQFGRRKSE
jgi:uncharacterized protein (TIGR04206 family)